MELSITGARKKLHRAHYITLIRHKVNVISLDKGDTTRNGQNEKQKSTYPN